MTRAGAPAAIAFSGMSRTSTDPAPITAPAPTWTPARTITACPSQAPSPILIGPLLSSGCLMIVIPGNRAVVVGIKGAAGRDLDIAPDLDAGQKRVEMASGLNVGFFADANAGSGTRLDEGIAVNLHAVVQL